MDRRIAPPSDYDELLDRLSEPHPGGQVALFQTRQKQKQLRRKSLGE